MQTNHSLEVNRESELDPDWSNPLLTDMYQVKMAYAEWKGGRHDEVATFELFFRKTPFKGRFTVFGGVDEVVQFL